MKRSSPDQNSCSSKRLCEEATASYSDDVYVIMDSYDLQGESAADMRKEMRAVEFVYTLLQLPPYYTGGSFTKYRIDMIMQELRKSGVAITDIKEATIVLSTILAKISNCMFRVALSDVRDNVHDANSYITSFNQCPVVKVLEGNPKLNFSPLQCVPLGMFVIDTTHVQMLEQLANCKVEQREWR